MTHHPHSVAAEVALSVPPCGQRGTNTVDKHTADRKHWAAEYARLRKIGDRQGAKAAQERCRAATNALLAGSA